MNLGGESSGDVSRRLDIQSELGDAVHSSAHGNSTVTTAGGTDVLVPRPCLRSDSGSQ